MRIIPKIVYGIEGSRMALIPQVPESVPWTRERLDLVSMVRTVVPAMGPDEAPAVIRLRTVEWDHGSGVEIGLALWRDEDVRDTLTEVQNLMSEVFREIRATPQVQHAIARCFIRRL